MGMIIPIFVNKSSCIVDRYSKRQQRFFRWIWTVINDKPVWVCISASIPDWVDLWYIWNHQEWFHVIDQNGLKILKYRYRKLDDVVPVF